MIIIDLSKNIYINIKNRIVSFYESIINFPKLCKIKWEKLILLKSDFLYKMQHLAETNYNLGLQHLYKNNFNDAILRFKFVTSYLKKNDSMSNYWMGWTYFLKNNIAKSLEYLEKSDNIDAINLKQFLYKYNEYTLIPNNIWSIYRDIISPKYNSKFLDKSINLPNQFVKLISKNIINLPKHYKILEIGSNIGMIGEYLPKYFLDSYDVEAIESSKIMCESLTLDSSLNVIYNKLSNIDLNNFLNSNKNKYDVIISFSSLCFTSNIETYICEIYKIINDNQYFAICLPIHDDDSVNINISTNEFNFNEGYLLDILTTNYFNIIISKKITLENNQKYCMIIARKAKF